GGQFVTQTLTLGQVGTGILTIQNSGVVTIGEGTGTLVLGGLSSGVGQLRIGEGGTAGTLNAAQITTGEGRGSVVFSHASPQYTFDPVISGRVSVSHTGSGTTTLTGNHTYLGTTDVSLGTLIVEG